MAPKPSNKNSIILIRNHKEPKGNGSSNNNKIAPVTRQPLVARISLWTTRPTGGLTGGRDSGNDSEDDDDERNFDDHDEDDDEQQRNEEFGDDLDENAQLENRLKQANLPDYVRRVTVKELQKLRRTPSFMSDYAVTRSYLELIADLPWNEQTPELIDLKKCRRDLDNDHYGMQKLKERVLQYLAVRKLRNQQQSASPATRSSSAEQESSSDFRPRVSSAQPILMFVGPPGTGKTSIAQSIASSLGRRFQRISLGGVADQAAIRGHRRTYIGAMPGRIIQGVKQVGVNNPVFLLDELDKMSSGPQGDPSGALLEVLDPEQNHTFTDHYLNVAFDLSRVLFIATANSLDSIPAALIDRMEVIQVPGYTQEEKFNIARRHLVPKQLGENGLAAGSRQQLVFRDEALHRIISHYAREAGVRQLERRVAAVCRVVAVRIVEGSCQPPLPVVVDAESLDSYLGPPVFDRETSAGSHVPGVAVGLAWTAAGGEITFVEADIMKGGGAAASGSSVGSRRADSSGSGSGGLVLTGQLGSVMRESATLALNWLRANFHAYDQLPASLGRDLVENTVHVHFPAGAVGKDGPSAGVTIVVALVSLCARMSVAPDLAMTGEITLRGVVLKVGGVKSKVLAAHRAGIKRVILPARNEPDLSDIPAGIKDKMKFHFVATIDEVLRLAFDNKLVAKSQLNSLPLDPSRGLTSKL